jgi:aspartyl-tRNA(Asn)/glutamyl-tRNA(Gln) amidotransferase subunit A
MPIPSLSQAIADASGDPGRATALACAAAAAVGRSDEQTHAFISVIEESSIRAATPSGPLLGCIFSVKDNIDVRGSATTCGSRLLENNRPSQDAWIVTALQSAGALCIGKNNMHELALGATGVNARFGTTTTPWDRARSAGGSSGGSAVAVARRMVHLSIGTDSGGSVRIPASMCGVVGFKPTAGALPMEGVAGAALTMDSLGLFATEVGDVRRAWNAIVRRQRSPSTNTRVKLAYLHDESMGRVDSLVWARYQQAVKSLRDSGISLTGISMTGLSASPYVCVSIVYPEVASLHHDLVRAHPELYSGDIRALFYLGELWSAKNYVDAQRLRTVLRDRLSAIIGRYDAVLTPTAAIQPPRIGEKAQVAGDLPGSELYTLIRFTVALNVTGYPAISVPAGLDSDGLPVGLQLIGKPHRDAALLDVAQRVEAALGVMPPAPSVS